MDKRGVKFIKGAVPSKIVATEDDKREVSWNFTKDPATVAGTKVFDTVMLAVGRKPDTKNLGLETVNIE